MGIGRIPLNKMMEREMDVYVTRKLIAAVCTALLTLAGAAASHESVGVWWWNGRQIDDAAAYGRRLDFLCTNHVTEIYFCAELTSPADRLTAFVRAAAERGMRVAWLAGDVSWIFPENDGFERTLERFIAYRRSAPPDAQLFALHLDVEPHQDAKLADGRKWQLYADFVVRATRMAHRAGVKIEWDIPFWLDDIRVAYGHDADVPLLDVIMRNSDGVALMSYRDTAQAMLDVSRTEIRKAASFPNCRVILGAETGESSETEIVTYFEEGRAAMAKELAIVQKRLAAENIPAGHGIAIHHVGGWLSLKD